MKRKFVIIPKGKRIISALLSVFILITCLVITFLNESNRFVKIAAKEEVYSVYYRGNTQEKRVTLMFNVYWGNEYIDRILGILDKNNVKTTFFIGGIWAEKYPNILKKIAEKGHEIGSHGYSHKDHSRLNYAENLNEIKKTEIAIDNIIGQKVTLFAPPSGYIGDAMLRACHDLDYRVIMWSNDTIDWRDKNSELIYKRAIKNATGGELILMHPTQNTADALQRIIDWYKSNGFSIVNVSENLS